jgi:hypothetical protein
MAFTAKNGKNGLIYVSVVSSAGELPGANAWTFNIESESIEYAKFGDSFKGVFAGLKGWGGSISALHDHAASILQDAAAYDGTVLVAIYPDREDGSAYYTGSAIFSFSSEGSMDAAVGQSADFTGTGTPSVTGFD